MSDILDQALGYLQRGWSVIPIHRKTKRPTLNWSEFCDRLPTEEEVRSWWKQWPTANIAVICGEISGVVVVDVDPGHGGKVEPLQRDYPTGLVAKTGGGGWHLFYRRPKGSIVKNATNIRPGVDIRGDRGYVVVPGSIHKSGQSYEWLREDEPAMCPAWVYEKENVEEFRVSSDDNWLSSTLRGVGLGDRNNAMTRLAGYFVSKNMPRDVIEEMLHLWRTRVEDPASLTNEEISRTVSHAYRNYKRGEPTGDAEHKMAMPMRFQMWALQHHSDNVRWLVEDWWPESSIGLAVSEPGLFKTWMLFDLAVSVATGCPFLGKYPVARQGPTVVVQQEDYSVDITSRITKITESKAPGEHSANGDSWEGRFVNPPVWVYGNRDFRFDSPDLDDWFDDVVAEIVKETGQRPALLTIDPLYATVDVDDYLAKAVPHMSRVKDWRDKHGTAVIIAHHTRKSMGGDWSRMDTYGSVFIDAFLESGWQFRRPRADMEGDLVIVRHHKRTGNPPPLLMKFDLDNYVAELSEIDDGNKTDEDAENTKLEHDVFELLIKKGALTKYAIRKTLDMHDRKVRRALAALKKGGKARETEDGKKWRALDQPEVDFS